MEAESDRLAKQDSTGASHSALMQRATCDFDHDRENSKDPCEQ